MIKTGQAITAVFVTVNPATGGLADADDTPTGTLYVAGAASAAAVTVTNITTGLYKAAVTLPSLTAGQVASLVISATVSGVGGLSTVWSEVADTVIGSDLATAIDTVDNFLDTEVAAITAAVITNAAGTDIAADIIALKAETADILTDTGTTLDTLVKDIPTNAELATALGTADDAVLAAITAAHSTTDGKIDAVDDLVDTEVAAIKSVVDLIKTAADAILVDTSTTLDTNLLLALKLLRNKVVTDQSTGEITVYDDDSTTPLYTAQLWADVAETVAFSGDVVNVRERLE